MGAERRPKKEFQTIPGLTLVTQGLSSEIVIGKCRDFNVHHVVQYDSPSFDQEIELAQAMNESPEDYLARPHDYIISKYDHSLEIECGVQVTKNEVLDKFESFMDQLENVRVVRESAHLVADEIFTNAKKNIHADPQHPVQIDFIARADAKRLVFGCIDNFGTLKIDLIISKIASVYERGVAASIQQGQSGAGIGTFLIYNSTVGLYLGVDQKRRTTVFCSLPLVKRARELEVMTKNIHLLY